jgi:hypothetical protein
MIGGRKRRGKKSDTHWQALWQVQSEGAIVVVVVVVVFNVCIA